METFKVIPQPTPAAPSLRSGQALKGGARPLWPVMALLVLAFASLAAAQKPGVSSKPVAKPVATLVKARWRVLGARPLAMYY
jgi:hypothetical protein